MPAIVDPGLASGNGTATTLTAEDRGPPQHVQAGFGVRVPWAQEELPRGVAAVVLVFVQVEAFVDTADVLRYRKCERLRR